MAESLGIAGLSEEVSSALAADVEYRLRDVIEVGSNSIRKLLSFLSSLMSIPLCLSRNLSNSRGMPNDPD